MTDELNDTPTMWVTIPGKLLTAAQKMCTKEVSRPTLKSICIRDRHLCATNGHILLRSPPPGRDPIRHRASP